jgi:hypothetical protein
MLFLTYWELSESMSVEERLQVAQKLTSSGLFPPRGSTFSAGMARPMDGGYCSWRQTAQRMLTWPSPHGALPAPGSSSQPEQHLRSLSKRAWGRQASC